MSKKTESAKEATASALKASEKAFASGEDKDHKAAIAAHKVAVTAHDAASGEQVAGGERVKGNRHASVAGHHINMIRAHNSALDGTGHGGRAKEDYDRAANWMKESTEDAKGMLFS